VDLAQEEVAYSIRKSIGSTARLERARAYASDDRTRFMLELLRTAGQREPIEALHMISGA
jgi:hypothetical protein